jgi:hypothetical protein
MCGVTTVHAATRVPREDEYSAVTLPPPDPKFRPSIVRAVPPLVGRVNEGLPHRHDHTKKGGEHRSPRRVADSV